MKYILTLKGHDLTSKAEGIIVRQVASIEKKLTNFAEDTAQLTIILKKHGKNHFFSGTLTLTLPKKKLAAKVGGHEIADVLHEGFDKLNKTFEVYKAKHFKGSSKYPNHTSINETL